MLSLNELCSQADHLNPSLSQACALPRAPSDMAPLPEPHADVSFDSSWEALFEGTPVALPTDD